MHVTFQEWFLLNRNIKYLEVWEFGVVSWNRGYLSYFTIGCTTGNQGLEQPDLNNKRHFSVLSLVFPNRSIDTAGWCSVVSDSDTYCCGFGAKASCLARGLEYAGPETPCEVRLVTSDDGTTTCEGLEGESGNLEVDCDCEGACVVGFLVPCG